MSENGPSVYDISAGFLTMAASGIFGWLLRRVGKVEDQMAATHARVQAEAREIQKEAKGEDDLLWRGHDEILKKVELQGERYAALHTDMHNKIAATQAQMVELLSRLTGSMVTRDEIRHLEERLTRSIQKGSSE